MTKNASRQYQTQQIMTASSAMLVFMLFDKAISSLNAAVRAIAANDVQERWRANNRAMEVIFHLQMTLNMELGGEVAENLDRLYGFMLNRLPRVDMKNDPKPAEEVIELLEPLRESWRELANQGDKPAREAAKIAAEAKAANGGNGNRPTPEAPGKSQDQGPGAPEGPDTPKAHKSVSVFA
jgi:flagellar protein FliS